MAWHSHLFKNFPQFIVIHTVKGFGLLNEAEIDVFLELSCFFDGIVWYFEHSLALPSFGIGMKTDLSSPVATAKFSKFLGILSVAL